MDLLTLLENEPVEWKKLEDVPEVKVVSAKKKLKKNEYKDNGKYPILDQGQEYIVGYTDDETALFEMNEYIIFGDHTESFKYVDFRFAQGADGIKVLRVDAKHMNARYTYHVLEQYYKKTGKYMRHYSLLRQTIIPIPSLEVQEKIAKTLDKFTKYVTELQTELQKRIDQYTYYRDTLLSEEYIQKLCKEMETDRQLRIASLGEIGTFTRGNGLQKKDFQEKGKPVIHYGQLYTKYGFSADNVVSYTDEKVFEKLRKAYKNDILIATTSENIEDVGKCLVWLGDEEVGFSGDMYSYRTDENAKYIAYYFQSAQFQKQKERIANGTKVIRIHSDDMKKIEIPLPPLVLQYKIVTILDKFQAMIAGAKGLLPTEIEQRQLQYEYYREKLLTFNGECDSTHARTHARTHVDYI